jgi:hypothetical protein
MDLEFTRLRRTAGVAALILGAIFAVSCSSSSYSAPSTGLGSASAQSLAYVSQQVSLPVSSTFPGGVPPGLFIIDATKDLRAPGFIGTNNSAGQMVLAPTKTLMLVIAPQGNTVALVANSNLSFQGTITLPNQTESIVINPASTTGYAAVPNAPVPGESPGAIFVLDLTGTGSFVSTVPIAAAHYVAGSHNGNRLLVFSDNQDSVTVVNTSNVGVGFPPLNSCLGNSACTTVAGFDRPVYAFFSDDDTTAWVLNCGAECGGTAASVQKVDLNTNTLVGAAVPVDGATVGLVSGSTLYVAGNSPTATACTGETTAATTCGRLDVVDLPSMTRTASYVITDGFHSKMDVSVNGQLYVGAQRCTEVNVSGGEIRGCLSVLNTTNGSVLIPPQAGDVTGLAAIPHRDVLYVVQNAIFQIYDTTKNKLGPSQPTLIGQQVDVKAVNF